MKKYEALRNYETELKTHFEMEKENPGDEKVKEHGKRLEEIRKTAFGKFEDKKEGAKELNRINNAWRKKYGKEPEALSAVIKKIVPEKPPKDLEITPEKEKNVQSAIENYRNEFLKTSEMRSDFVRKGYVRVKQPDEKAYHDAKKQFGGEFNLKNIKAMETNTNKGMGVDVNLPDGGTHHLDNQKELFDKIVSLNKKYGKFYNEELMKKDHQKDYARLLENQERLETAKKRVINAYGKEDIAFKAIRTLEMEIKKEKSRGFKNKSFSNSKGSENEFSSNGKNNQEPEYELKNDGEIDTDRIRKPTEELMKKFYAVKKLGREDYYWQNSEKLAFKDKGKKIVTKSNNKVVAVSIVELADSSGWKKIKVRGSDAFKRNVWLEASLRGIETKGYKPSKLDIEELDKQVKKVNTVERLDEKIKEQIDKNQPPGLEEASQSSASSDSKKNAQEKLDPKQKELKTVFWEKAVDEALADHPELEEAHKLNSIANEVAKNKIKIPEKIKEPDQDLSKQQKSLIYKHDLKSTFYEKGAEEALDKHPELKEVYVLTGAAKELADQKIGNPESRKEFTKAVQEMCFNELAKGKRLPEVEIKPKEETLLKKKEIETEAER